MFGVLSLNIYSQSSNDTQLAQFIPPSPTAYELTKYGNIELNESSGEIATSIDLYNFKAGRLNVPISMSYAGAGIKVDQLCSWTGINWNLRAGGLISRTVRDRMDEKYTRKFYTSEMLNNLTATDSGIELLRLMYGNADDTEVDIFNFNFAGYSGSFYLDENLQPKLANYNQELKIEFVTSPIQDVDSQQILITDSNGIKYYFGGTGATERTRSDLSGASWNTLQNPITAYYLVKIQNPVLDEINFTYLQELSDYNVKIGTNEFYTKQFIEDQPGFPHYVEHYSGISTTRTKTYNGKYLSKITNNRSNEEVHFSSTEYDGNEHYHRILNNIKITQNKGNNNYVDFKNYALQYHFKNGAANSTRFFLESLTAFNGNNIKDQQHTFEYKDLMNMPDRLSFTKDCLGYYNGTSNSSGLPLTNNDNFLSLAGVIMANRAPNFIHAVTGTLTKIKYPTGGSTTFDYEGIPAKKYIYTSKSLSVYNKLAILNPSAHPIPDTQLINTLDFGLAANEAIYQNQDVVFKIHVTAQGTLNHNCKVRIFVQDYEDIVEQTYSFDLEYGVFIYDKEITFNLLQGGNYFIKAELLLPNGTNSPAVDVDIDYKYVSNVQFVDGVSVRVKRIMNNPTVGASTIKRYYYNKVNDINKTDDIPFKNDFYGINIETLSYRKNEMRETNITGSDAVFPILNIQHTLSSAPVRDILPDHQKTYQYVTTSFGGDNFENGGLQRTYRSINAQNATNIFSYYPIEQQQNNIDFPASSVENRDLYNGEMVEEMTFVNDSGLLKMNKKSYSTFLDETPDYIMNLNIKSIFNNTIGYIYETHSENLQRIHHLYFGLYKTFINKKQLQSQVSIDYMEPVPVNNMVNANSYKQVSTTTEYFYQPNLVGLPVRMQTTSSTGDILKTDIEYSTALKHISKHQLSEVSKTTTSKNDTLLSTKKTIYGDFNPHYLPSKIQTSKGTSVLEDRINFIFYDNYGNPIELNKTNDMHVLYIWGYNKTQPIAKIENPTYSTTTAGLVASAQTASDTGTEGTLLTALLNLRSSMPDAMITTLTYIPLLGVSTITDPIGDKISYSYDEHGRLKFVKDKNGNILSENQYHYKQ